MFTVLPSLKVVVPAPVVRLPAATVLFRLIVGTGSTDPPSRETAPPVPVAVPVAVIGLFNVMVKAVRVTSPPFEADAAAPAALVRMELFTVMAAASRLTLPLVAPFPVSLVVSPPETVRFEPVAVLLLATVMFPPPSAPPVAMPGRVSVTGVGLVLLMVNVTWPPVPFVAAVLTVLPSVSGPLDVRLMSPDFPVPAAPVVTCPVMLRLVGTKALPITMLPPGPPAKVVVVPSRLWTTVLVVPVLTVL